MHGSIGKLFWTLALVLPLAIILPISCSKTEETFEAAPFTFSPELNAEAIAVEKLGLTLSPPLGWEPIDSTRLDLFRRMLGGTDLSREFYPVFPLTVFSDTVTQCIMYVALIDEPMESFSKIVNEYDDFLKPRLEGSALTKTNYLINDMKIHHYMLHSEQVVNYKLIGEVTPNQRFLIEYIIGGPFFVTVEPAVSSSMASLSKTGGM
jgi:hypothetical protein